MQIGLISDTHGHLEPRVFHHFKECDEIWHAGDIGTLDVLEKLEAFKPTRAVFGNIDGQEIRVRTKEYLRFEIEGLKVMITHIGGHPFRYPERVKSEIKAYQPGLYICGHSHILKVQFDKTINSLHMNPGAAGKQGFHKVKTLLRFTIENATIKNLEIIELGPKSSADGLLT